MVAFDSLKQQKKLHWKKSFSVFDFIFLDIFNSDKIYDFEIEWTWKLVSL